MSGSIVALTGATGFIGKYLLGELALRGYQVRVLLRSPTALPPGCQHAVIGDLARPINMNAALSGVDTVIHSAGIAPSMTGAPAEDFLGPIGEIHAELHHKVIGRVYPGCDRDGIRSV